MCAGLVLGHKSEHKSDSLLEDQTCNSNSYNEFSYAVLEITLMFMYMHFQDSAFYRDGLQSQPNYTRLCIQIATCNEPLQSNCKFSAKYAQIPRFWHVRGLVMATLAYFPHTPCRYLLIPLRILYRTKSLHLP